MLDHSDSSSSAVLLNADTSNSDFDLENSFSVISDFIDDDFSFVSYCGSVGEIELTPAEKCYKHSRNNKLNKRLDFAVLFSFVLVTGLGIGNFIGRTDNCLEHHTDQLHLFTDLGPAMHIVPNNKRANIMFDDKGSEVIVSAKTTSDKETTASLMKTPLQYRSSLVAFADSLANQTPSLMVEIKNITDLHHNTQQFRSLVASDDAHFLAGEEFSEKFELLVPLPSNLMYYPEIHFSLKEHMTYSDVLDILNNDIKEIFQGIKSLVSTALNKQNIDYGEGTHLDKMFQAYCDSVEQKTKELSNLVSTFAFKNPVNGKKQFMKMSHVIMKSVDILLNNDFVKSLLKSEKNVDYRLKNICDMGYDVIKGLEKKWNAEKQKLMYHLAKREKLQFENKNHQIKYDKKEKPRNKYKIQYSKPYVKNEKKDAEYHKEKQNKKLHITQNKQVFRKKQY